MTVLGEDAIDIPCVLSEDCHSIFPSNPTNNRGVNHVYVVSDDYFNAATLHGFGVYFTINFLPLRMYMPGASSP